MSNFILEASEYYYNALAGNEALNALGSPNSSSLEQFSASVDIAAGLVLIIKDVLEETHGVAAVSTMAVQTSGFAIGTLSFGTSLTKFEIALGQFNDDKTIANANNLVLAWADLTIGIGNLLMGINDTLTVGEVSGKTTLQYYGLFFIGVGTLMKQGNQISSSHPEFWEGIFKIADDFTGTTAELEAREAYGYAAFFAKKVDGFITKDTLNGLLDSSAATDSGLTESVEFLKAVNQLLGFEQ